jgi:hypothetical protein
MEDDRSVQKEEVLFLSLAEIAFLFSFIVLVVVLVRFDSDKEVTLSCDLAKHLLYQNTLLGTPEEIELTKFEESCDQTIVAGLRKMVGGPDELDICTHIEKYTLPESLRGTQIAQHLLRVRNQCVYEGGVQFLMSQSDQIKFCESLNILLYPLELKGQPTEEDHRIFLEYCKNFRDVQYGSRSSGNEISLAKACSYEDLLLINKAAYNALDSSGRTAADSICSSPIKKGSLSFAIGMPACFAYAIPESDSPFRPYAVASLEQQFDADNSVLSVTFTEELSRDREFRFADPFVMKQRLQIARAALGERSFDSSVSISYRVTVNNEGHYTFYPLTGDDLAMHHELVDYIQFVAKVVKRQPSKCVAYIQTTDNRWNPGEFDPKYHFLMDHFGDAVEFVRTRKSLD